MRVGLFSFFSLSQQYFKSGLLWLDYVHCTIFNIKKISACKRISFQDNSCVFFVLCGNVNYDINALCKMTVYFVIDLFISLGSPVFPQDQRLSGQWKLSQCYQYPHATQEGTLLTP